MPSLIYNLGKPKKDRPTLSKVPLGRDNWLDTEYIRNSFAEQTGVQLDEVLDMLRITLINDKVPTYRVSVLHNYKDTHTVRNREGTLVVLQPGVYVTHRFLVERVSPTEYVWSNK